MAQKEAIGILTGKQGKSSLALFPPEVMQDRAVCLEWSPILAPNAGKKDKSK